MEINKDSPYWWLRSEEAYAAWSSGDGSKCEVKSGRYRDMEKRRAYRREWMRRKRKEERDGKEEGCGVNEQDICVKASGAADGSNSDQVKY